MLATGAALAYAFHPAALFPASPHAGGTPSPAAVLSFQPHPGELRARAPRTLVYVAGAVVRPGVYGLAADARASDALAQAGGAKPDADMAAVNLAAHVSDGDEIAVPRIGEAARARPRDAHPRGSGSRRRRSAGRAGAPPPPANLLDVNSVGEAALADLPGIGPALAARIVAFRDANGPFSSVDELADVSGITASRLDKILPFVTVGNASP